MPHTAPLPATSHAAAPLRGRICVPGDKSISHRALMLSSQVLGTTTLHGLLEGEDVLNTARALQEMGVPITRRGDGSWVVSGVGPGGLHESGNVLDMGNSGTGARLMMGLCAPYPFATSFTGDESLRSRPMRRVMTPLEEMGMEFTAREGGKLPLTLHGNGRAVPISYTLPVASAQVKSALLLAGLNIMGVTEVIEPTPTRDHTERMLKYLGFQVETAARAEGGVSIRITGQPDIRPENRTLTIPGDPSSAAFLAVAALVVPGSELVIENVGTNPLRTGLYDSLREMGAEIRFENTREEGGEKVNDLHVKHSPLRGITVPAARAPSMIDEYPILAVAAAFATGETKMEGLEELKVKESNRLQAIFDGLRACGVTAEMGGDSLTVQGCGGPPPGDGTVATHYDHRIAMSFLVMGLAAQNPVRVDDTRAIATSFPGFSELLRGLGARVE